MSRQSSILKIFTKAPLTDQSTSSSRFKSDEDKDKLALDRQIQNFNHEIRPKQMTFGSKSSLQPHQLTTQVKSTVSPSVAPWFQDEISTAPKSGMLFTEKKSTLNLVEKRELTLDVAPWFDCTYFSQN